MDARLRYTGQGGESYESWVPTDSADRRASVSLFLRVLSVVMHSCKHVMEFYITLRDNQTAVDVIVPGGCLSNTKSAEQTGLLDDSDPETMMFDANTYTRRSLGHPYSFQHRFARPTTVFGAGRRTGDHRTSDQHPLQRLSGLLLSFEKLIGGFRGVRRVTGEYKPTAPDKVGGW